MDSPPSIEESLPKAPRWLQVCFGILLVPLSLLCMAGSVAMLASPAPKAPLLAAGIGVIFIPICVWFLPLAIRLIANRPNRGGLLGPFALRASAVLFPMIPLVGLFTGYYRQHGLIAVGRAAIYVFVALALWSLAKRRAVAA